MLKLRITFLMVLLAMLSSVAVLPGHAQDKDKKKKVYPGTPVMWSEPTDY